MKYYAVTEDPNELLHYGRLGMKWGKHIFGDDKPKSPGYKRAVAKLKAAKNSKPKQSSFQKTVSNIRSTLQKSAAQRAENKRDREEKKYQNAIQAAQRRTELSEAYAVRDAAKNMHKQIKQENRIRNRELREEQRYQKELAKAERRTEKSQRLYDLDQIHNEIKAEGKTEKYLQKAREGKLKYGKLTDAQVQRLNDRLALESGARRYEGQEQGGFVSRAIGAAKEGAIQGIARGSAAYMEERARGKARMKNAEKYGVRTAKAEGEANKARNRAQNKRSKREIQQDIKQEAQEEMYRSGEESRYAGETWGATLQRLQAQKRDQQRAERLEERHQQNLLDAQDRRDDKREQDIYADNRERDRFLEAAKSAYEFGYVPEYYKLGQGKKNGSGKSGGNKDGNTGGNNGNAGQGKKNGGGNKDGNTGGNNGNAGQDQNEKRKEYIKQLADYYYDSQIDGRTKQQRKADKVREAEEREAAEKAHKEDAAFRAARQRETEEWIKRKREELNRNAQAYKRMREAQEIEMDARDFLGNRAQARFDQVGSNFSYNSARSSKRRKAKQRTVNDLFD